MDRVIIVIVPDTKNTVPKPVVGIQVERDCESCLFGKVYNHPRFKAGHRVCTSRILRRFTNPDTGISYIETENTAYVLL
jgi:hypothetical protein